MDFKHHMETAWRLTLEHIVSLLLMTLVMVAVSAVTLGIMAPVTMAGYTWSILMMMRNKREPKIQDLFSQMSLFLPLLAFGFAVFIASMIGFVLLFLPGIAVILAVAFFCVYMIPLMIDKELGIVDAVKESYRMAISQPITDHIVVVIIFMAITMIGSTIFVGVLFTQPLATIFLISTYEEKIGATPPAPKNEPA